MRTREVKHTVYGRPGRAAPPSGLDVVASRGLLTWWDIMSDLDPTWLAWSQHLDAGDPRDQKAA